MVPVFEEIERLRKDGYDPVAWLREHPEWMRVVSTLYRRDLFR